ncbi:MAG: sulfotransferase family protein [Cellvibrio sp.]
MVPVGHATEPFQDEYISRCRQQLFNQIIQPCSSLLFAKQQADYVSSIQPSGFIFHLSRCGSTLISGCLSELDTTCVVSESPLLTELLLDKALSIVEQQNCLRAFINLQAAAFPERPQMIIKWNAWDIFCWELIRDIYPQVPTIFLVRDPVEILASHQRSAGRHMSGDPSLVVINPAFQVGGQPLLTWRSNLLAALLGEMKKFSCDPLVRLVDYRYLDANQIQQVAHHFLLPLDDVSIENITRRLRFHSKTPEMIFSDDRSAKQALFSAEDTLGIQQRLQPLYSDFLDDEALDTEVVSP